MKGQTMERNTQNEDIEIDLGSLFSLLFHKIFIIILMGLLFGALAFFRCKFFITPQYTSETKLYVLNRATDGTTTLTDLQTSTQLTKDYQILVTSKPVLNEVIKKLKLDMSPEELASAITVTTPSDTRVLQITVTNPDPYKAKEIVDEVAKASADQICEIMQIEKVNVIEEGNVSTTPISTGIKKNTIIGALMGIVLACAIVIIRSLLDDTIKDTDDVEKYLGLSTLSMIPICDEMDDGRGKNKRNKKGKANRKKEGR